MRGQFARTAKTPFARLRLQYFRQSKLSLTHAPHFPLQLLQPTCAFLHKMSQCGCDLMARHGDLCDGHANSDVSRNFAFSA